MNKKARFILALVVSLLFVYGGIYIEKTIGRTEPHLFTLYGAMWTAVVSLIAPSRTRKKRNGKTITAELKLTEMTFVKGVIKDFVKLIALCLKEEYGASSYFALKMREKYSKEFRSSKESGTCSTCKYGSENCGWLCSDGDLWEAKEEVVK